MAEKENQPKVSTVLIVLLLIAGAGFLYWQFYLKPSLFEIGALRDEKNELGLEVDRLKKKLEQGPEIELKWSSLQEKETYLMDKIPEKAALPQVLAALEQLVRSFPLEIEAFNVSAFQQEEQHWHIPVSLRVKGEAEDLLVLMEQLEQFKHMILTKQVSIEVTEEVHRLGVEFKVIFTSEGQAKAVGTGEEA